MTETKLAKLGEPQPFIGPSYKGARNQKWKLKEVDMRTLQFNSSVLLTEKKGFKKSIVTRINKHQRVSCHLFNMKLIAG